MKNLKKTFGVALLGVLFSLYVYASIEKSEVVTSACQNQLSNLYLAGSFLMPSSGQKVNLWVGQSKDGSDRNVKGLLALEDAKTCEAQCSVLRFERFKSDGNPALLELECEGSRLSTLRMPLHVQWTRAGMKRFKSVVRLGDKLSGLQEAALHIEVNQYSVASGK